jgi:hypothetical protein
MSIEAMKLALEALTATMATHGFREHIEETKDKAIEALEEALKQEHGEPQPTLYVKDIESNFHLHKEKGHTKNCAAFGDDCSENHLPPSRFGVGNKYSTVKQEQGKPVAWYHAEDFKTHFTTGPSEDLVKSGYWQPLYKKAAL